MHEARLPLRLFLGGSMAIALAAAVACGSGSSEPGAASEVDGGAAPSDSGRDTSSGNSSPDAGAKSTCELTRAHFEGCGNEADLNCGDQFDAWCSANDTAINSGAYRRAEAACLTSDNCDGAARRDCEYRHYNDETPTASQKALVAAYCEVCEPGDAAGCTKRSTTYEPAKGINSVGDIFIAAWEFGDAIVDEMKTSCTGPAADPGTDTTSCAKAFANCTAEVYLDRLPDCPK
jgi:hypothetical protein